MSDKNNDVPSQALSMLSGFNENLLSSTFLTTVFDHFSEAVMVADINRVILYVNEATLNLFGYTKAELYGQETKILYAVKDEFAAQGKKRFNSQSKVLVENFRIAYRRADGGTFVGLTTGGVMRTKEQEVIGFMGIIRPARTADESLDTLQKLHGIAADFSLSYEQRIELLLKIGLDHFGLETAIQSHIVDDSYTVEHCVDKNAVLLAGTTFNLADTYCIHTLNAKQSLGFHYVGNSEIKNHPCYQNFKLESYIGASIDIDNQLYGTINFSGQLPTEPFSKDDYILVNLLADMLSYLIYKKNYDAKLWELATTDDLTGLPNRRATLERLAQHVDLSHRVGSPCTVVSIDIDHFKSINDKWGHSTGDYILQAFARIALKIGRSVDLCGRLGGEEFVLLLPNTDAKGGKIVADQLRAMLKAEPIKLINGHLVFLEISAGVASLKISETVESLLARADDSMYVAKKNGRNQVCINQT